MHHKGRVGPRKRDSMWARGGWPTSPVPEGTLCGLWRFVSRSSVAGIAAPDLLQTARPALGLVINRAAPVMALFVR
jgi:hypothetical protein